MTNDPKNPEYDAKARDAIMDLCPFYDPNHKCGIVREHVFKDCLTELRERERLALESARRLDALSSAGMAKILELESKLAKWESGAAAILPPGTDPGESGVAKMFFDSFEELKAEKAYLQKNWDSDTDIFAGAIQLLKEAGIKHGSREIIAASERFYEANPKARRKDAADGLDSQNAIAMASADEKTPPKETTL